MTDRTYTEEEVSRLIKRASELEVKRREKSGGIKTGEGLTLDEIASVASEAGMDPGLIRKAAAELDSQYGSSDEVGAKEGTSDKEIFAERWLNSIPEMEEIDTIIADLDHRYREGTEKDWWEGGKPKVSKTGRTIEWTYTDVWEVYERRVLFQPRGKRFRIRVSKRIIRGGTWEYRYTGMLNYVPYILAIGVVFTGYALDSMLAGIALAAGLFVILYPFIKKYNQRNIDKHKAEVIGTADELAGQFRLISESKPDKRSTERLDKNTTSFGINEDEPGGKEKPDQQKNQIRNNS